MPKSRAYNEVDWDKLDKQKFFYVGAGMFTGVTTLLYPITVLKTRQMASDGVASGFKGVSDTTRMIWQTDGVRGFYRGFSTVVFGALPSRVVYLTVLEYTKSMSAKALHPLNLSETSIAASSNFLGAAAASIANQALVVPVDVISQRQMMHGAAPRKPPTPPTPPFSSTPSSKPFTTAALNTPQPPPQPPSPAAHPRHISGLQMARLILRQEGVAGLYRGLGASLFLYTPSSAIWWGCYGAYQKVIWGLLPEGPSVGLHQHPDSSQVAEMHKSSDVVAVQTLASVLAGATSAMITNPLDLVKTRLQVMDAGANGGTPTFRQVLGQVLREDGWKGMWRGVVPRAANSILWGTTMVSVYELLKRMCALPEEQVVQQQQQQQQSQQS